MPLLSLREIHVSPHSREGSSYFPPEGRFILLPTLGKNHPSSQGKFIPALTPGKVHPTSHFRGDLSYLPLQGRFSPLLSPREIHPSSHSKKNSSLPFTPWKVHPSPHSRGGGVYLSSHTRGDSFHFHSREDTAFSSFQGRFNPFLTPDEIHPSSHSWENSSLSLLPGEMKIIPS
jgi:hypothetical protein